MIVLVAFCKRIIYNGIIKKQNLLKRRKRKMGKIITCHDGTQFERVSRWITVDYKDITQKHALACYGEEMCESEKLSLHCFRFQNSLYAIQSFWGLGNPVWMPNEQPYYFNEGGEKHAISAVDMDGNIYNPLYCEFHEWGEKVRLYRKLR